jgi:predicted amidohydrolase YtcJ
MRRILIRNCTFPGAESGSMLIEDGIISRKFDDPAPAAVGDASVVDANRGTILPGLTDTHCHPFEYGWLKRNVDLRGTSNITSVRMRLSARLQREPKRSWVSGMGWDQEAFSEGRMPSRQDIDDISPDNPVVLTRVCGHIALLNTRALEALGIEGSQGPEYERDSSGYLTGIVKENALTRALASLPRTEVDCEGDLLAFETEASRVGLVGVHCIVSPEGFREELAALENVAKRGQSALRYRVYIPFEAMSFVEGKKLRSSLAGDRVRINGVKIYGDGSLGARTAALREPYSDDAPNDGLLRHSDEELARMVEEADSAGYQVVVHAIGDRAVEQAIGAISIVSGARNPRGHRIDHASLLPPDLASEMAKHGIRAAVQPMFVSSDTWAVRRLGEERARYLYPFKSMLDRGIVMSGSSDSPVEALSPVLGVWAAMAAPRVDRSESLSLDESLSLYTSTALSNGLDGSGGPLREGDPADLTLFDSDIGGMHPALLRKVAVAMTLVGGAETYSALPAEG